MAKVTVNLGVLSVEGESQKEIFEELAAFGEVFGQDTCGGCGKKNLRFVVREQEDGKGKKHKYYELRCLDCYAKLPYGQHDNGKTLFPKKWVRWDRESNQQVEL